MPPKSRPVIGLLVTVTILTTLGSGLLYWQWRNERHNYQLLLAGKNQQLATAGQKNRRLTAENQGFQTEIAAKDQELTEKIKDLAKKQAALNDLSKQFDDKKKALDEAQKQIDNQKSQLTANADELAKLRNRPPLFSFQNKSSVLADIETKKAAVKQVVTDAYETIESLYGKPYLLHSVTISFVDSFGNPKASGEIVITNSDKGLDLNIHIKDFNRESFNDDNTIIHEVIHSFHGLASLEPTAFEEGITVAATDAVMKKMIVDAKLPRFASLYISISDAEFAAQQKSLSIPRDTTAFYGSEKVADFYQVLGKAWYKLYEADADFFKKFNEKIYANKNAGQDLTEQMVLDTVRAVAPNTDLTGAAWQLH